MRSEREMYDLILNTAREDGRIRAVILNGSRANPHAPRDIFQDYDIVYGVTEVAPFRHDPAWIDRFGERMILQLPDEMRTPPAGDDEPFCYLMQFTDGNRIDLTLCSLARLDDFTQDSLTVVLLDKDGSIAPVAPPDERGYLPAPPTAKAYADCCNEFWWVATYVAKGLWREEIVYAKAMLEQIVRVQLVQMLTWYIGVKTEFLQNPGKAGKYFERCLEPALWERLRQTYADGDYERTWDALLTMGDLFRITALRVGEQLGFDYPQGDDARVGAHLRHVRSLPRDAQEIY